MGLMKLVLMHNENIKTFIDISYHIKLEIERLGYNTPFYHLYG